MPSLLIDCYTTIVKNLKVIPMYYIMKIRVSLSLDKKIIEQIDFLTDGIKFRSRSDTIEKILKKSILERKTCVVFAGGIPEELFIPDANCYRSLVKVNGLPLIEHIVKEARENNYREFIIIGHPKVIGSIYDVLGNGKRLSINIEYIEELEARGTGKTLEKVRERIKNDFLFVACDIYFKANLLEVEKSHFDSNNIVTLLAYAKGDEELENSSTVIMEGNRVIDFEERAQNPRSNLMTAFVGIMSPRIFDLIPRGDLSWSLQHNVFPKLAKEGKLYGYIIPNKWINVHKLEDVGKITHGK